MCSDGLFKEVDGPGACTRCPPATAAVGSQAADHDSSSDCRAISCPRGMELDLVAGKCRVCSANFVKVTPGSQPCSRCPPGTVTLGDAVADHDEESDCLEVGCGPGEELDASTGSCHVCGRDKFKAGDGPEACTHCPDGTRTLGLLARDHDGPDDCLPGAMQAARQPASSKQQQQQQAKMHSSNGRVPTWALLACVHADLCACCLFLCMRRRAAAEQQQHHWIRRSRHARGV